MGPGFSVPISGLCPHQFIFKQSFMIGFHIRISWWTMQSACMFAFNHSEWKMSSHEDGGWSERRGSEMLLFPAKTMGNAELVYWSLWYVTFHFRPLLEGTCATTTQTTNCNTMRDLRSGVPHKIMHCAVILMIKCGNSSLLVLRKSPGQQVCSTFRSGWSQMKNGCLDGISCC